MEAAQIRHRRGTELLSSHLAAVTTRRHSDPDRAAAGTIATLGDHACVSRQARAGDTKTVARTIAHADPRLVPVVVPHRGIGGPVSAGGRPQCLAAGAGIRDLHHGRGHAQRICRRATQSSVLPARLPDLRGQRPRRDCFTSSSRFSPRALPIDRKVPWLKWALLVAGICLGLGGYRHGDSKALPFILAVLPDRIAQNARIVVVYGSVFLGLISLLCNMFSVSSTDDRRKLKVIFWGTVVGVTPAVVIALVQEVFHAEISFWLNFVKVILLFLFPLSFAYAVVKHRVMDIPVLLKRSARYFVVERGFVFLILAISVGLTLWFGQAFSRHFSAGSKAAIPIGATLACC